MDASIPSPLSGSDVVVVRAPVRERVALPLTTDIGAATNTLQVAAGSTNGVATGDIALAYSCEAHLRVPSQRYYASGTGVISHVANATGPGAWQCEQHRQLFIPQRRDLCGPVETVAYFVAPSSRVGDASDPAPAGTTSLWRRRGLNAAEELVEGIEQFQVQYGVDTNGDVIVDEYRTADHVTDWNDVISVSVALLGARDRRIRSRYRPPQLQPARRHRCGARRPPSCARSLLRRRASAIAFA
jgi:type IV pilus assembly protein PilW